MKNRPSPYERAKAYLEKIPGAVSGCRGHDATFGAACKMAVGFDLDEMQVKELMAEWNQTCDPPWSEKELDHKVRSAMREKDRSNDVGSLLESHDEQIERYSPTTTSPRRGTAKKPVRKRRTAGKPGFGVEVRTPLKYESPGVGRVIDLPPSLYDRIADLYEAFVDDRGHEPDFLLLSQDIYPGMKIFQGIPIRRVEDHETQQMIQFGWDDDSDG